MEKNNIGKKALCSRCTEEKIIASSGFGSEPYGDLCADCLEASSNYACDICDKELKCELTNHIYFKSIVENKWRNTYQ